jgi:phospholipid transport system transporter-binding protein
MSAQLEEVEDSWFRLTGELNFDSVPELLKTSTSLFRDAERIDIDLSGVVRSGSAGLALLVEWMRQAEKMHKPIQFLNIPLQMMAIVRVSGLDQVCPISRATNP